VQGVSAVDQYVEAIPTSSGPAPTGSSRAAPRPLPPQVEAEVRATGGADAEELIEIATSPTYGAPSRPTLKPTLKDPDGVGDVGIPDDAQPSALDAVISPVAEADEPRLLVLLALLAAMTVLAFGLAVRR
jgi:hypothetical protein